MRPRSLLRGKQHWIAWQRPPMAIRATKVTCLHPPLRSTHAAKRPLRLIRMRSARHFDAIVQIRFTRCWRKLSWHLHSASGLRRMSRARGVFAAKLQGASKPAAKRPRLSNPSDLARAQQVKMYWDACIHTRVQLCTGTRSTSQTPCMRAVAVASSCQCSATPFRAKCNFTHTPARVLSVLLVRL